MNRMYFQWPILCVLVLACGGNESSPEADVSVALDTSADTELSVMGDAQLDIDSAQVLECQRNAQGPNECAAPFAENVFCCPIEEPSCNCFATGGTSPECNNVCDAAPSGVLEQDDNGCYFYEPSDESCLTAQPDAG